MEFHITFNSSLWGCEVPQWVGGVKRGVLILAQDFKTEKDVLYKNVLNAVTI